MSQKKILIFGLGSALDDCDRWDEYVRNGIQYDLGEEFVGAQWFGVSAWSDTMLKVGNYLNNVFVGDFNNLDDLKKMSHIESATKICADITDTSLHHNVYDVITLDYSTTKYVQWTPEHIGVVYSMLKTNGRVYIEKSGMTCPQKMYMKFGRRKPSGEYVMYYLYSDPEHPGKQIESTIEPTVKGLIDDFKTKFTDVQLLNDQHYPIALQTETTYDPELVAAAKVLQIGVPTPYRQQGLTNLKKSPYFVFTKH
jgi:hypothetical protein